jgi:hypothetical protein
MRTIDTQGIQRQLGYRINNANVGIGISLCFWIRVGRSGGAGEGEQCNDP